MADPSATTETPLKSNLFQHPPTVSLPSKSLLSNEDLSPLPRITVNSQSDAPLSNEKNDETSPHSNESHLPPRFSSNPSHIFKLNI